jgi:ribonuclease BN (tRNA processing enzyme)
VSYATLLIFPLVCDSKHTSPGEGMAHPAHGTCRVRARQLGREFSVCEYVGQAYGLSRRGFLGAAAGAAAVAGLGVTAGPARAGGRGAGGQGRGDHDADRHRTRLVLLGTAGGPSWYTPDRMGIPQALIVEDVVYVIDCGEGLGPRLLAALDATPGETLSSVRALFITHLHSDHTIDYVDFPIVGHWNGLNDPEHPVQVHGPGNRGGLPPVFPPTRPAPAVMNPADPTPGITGMTDYILKAWAADQNDRMRDSGATDPRQTLSVHDIALPSSITGPVDHNPMPPVDPFPVYEDDLVRVTATLVNHAPVFPSFAFRFDTDDGSVTISGDTSPSDNLVKLAKDTDILVHECIDAQWVDQRFPQPRTPEIEGLVAHLLGSHTSIEQVGPVADRAGATTLVLSHLVPANNPVANWQRAQRNFSGRLVVGEDLMRFGVGAKRRRAA